MATKRANGGRPSKGIIPGEGDAIEIARRAEMAGMLGETLSFVRD